jgi:hypothetical protein
MQDFINEHHLNSDVLSVYGLPRRVHAAYYACATLSVAPTLFEGGFPGPFSESLSVGTPVLLSDIPVVRELLPPEILSVITFDPYNIDLMVEKIDWGIRNRNALFGIENDFFLTLKKRTWNDVIQDYINVFQCVSKKPDRDHSNL